ncbi:MAG: type I phosphomannose isomerase catalytic subunit, partial [Candidatus Izemoplasmatales bacterium]
MKRQLIFLSPDLKQRIWGGAWLKTLFHSDSPDPIGEAWLISGMAEGSAKIVSGPGSSRTLRDYFMSNRSAFSLATSMEFPLLVKIIDAKTKLSVQVHPTDKYAQLKENGSGKTECWYVLEAEEGSTLVLGHRAQTKAELEQMIKEERWHDLLV